MSFFRLSIIFLAGAMSVADLWSADRDMDMVVLVRGQKLSAQDVLKQVEAQTPLRFEVGVEDAYGYRSDYNHSVRVAEVIEAFKSYHRDFNKLDVDVVHRSEQGYALVVKREPLVEPQDLPEPKAASAPAPKGRDLQVEIVDRQRDTSDSFLKHFQRKDKAAPARKETPQAVAGKAGALESLEDAEGMKAATPAQAPAKPKAEAARRPGWWTAVFAVNGQSVRETHFVTFDNAGLLTGFLAAPILPSRLLADGETEVGLAGFLLREDGSSRTGILRGSYDSDLYMMHVGARIPFSPGIEVVLDLPAGMHSGDYHVIGLPPNRRDLSFGVSDAVVGVNGDLGPVLMEDLRLMGGLRLKLPTGSTDDLLGTRHFDAGGHLALQKAVGPAVCFAQAGVTYYGTNENYPALDTGFAGQASLGAEWYMTDDLSLPVAFRWGQSPVHEKAVPGYVKDDQASLQAGVHWQRRPYELGLDLQAGLTDTVPDFGIGLSSTLRF